jgi:hypothetical protein
MQPFSMKPKQLKYKNIVKLLFLPHINNNGEQ